MKDAMISVIVPVYNVENYLEKCLNSLLNQVFRDYTIILVNDGSTDKSGQICNSYASNYPNKITVFHKENGGLSDARNYGVNRSSSQFVVFVDSDDYVGSYYLKRLFDAYSKYDCDLVVSNITREYVKMDGSVQREKEKNFEDFCMNQNDALIRSCYEDIFGSYAVSKLFYREHVCRHPYPTGKLFEDSFTTYMQILECSKIVCIKNPGYYYLQREGSIQRRNFEKRHFDLIYAVREMLDYFQNNNFSEAICTAGIYKLFKACHITLLHAIKSPEYLKVFEFCKSILNPYKQTLKKLTLSWKERIIFNIMLTDEKIYRYIFCLKEFFRYAQNK